MDKTDILELITELSIDLNEIDGSYELRDALDYNGRLHELIDSHIDIYYYNLRKWAVENYDFINQAIDEGLTQDADFHQMIQAGQYVYYTELAHELMEEIVEESLENRGEE